MTAADMQVVGDTGLNTLRRELWRRYASSRTDEPAEVALSKLKFLKTDRRGTLRATLGGVLLASEEPREWLPNAYIQAVCYEGGRMDGNRQLDAQDVGGPLDQQIRDAMRFVIRNRRVAARKDPARSDVPQYSERAVFEAVVNAVVHRDYAVSGSHIRLFMFDDRLELYSPGALGNSMTTADLRISQFTRNELLASRLGQCPAGDVSRRWRTPVLHRAPRRGHRRHRGRDLLARGREADVRSDRRAGVEARSAGGESAPARWHRVARLASPRCDRGTPARRACADALSRQDLAGGAKRRVRARGLRPAFEAADDGAVRRTGVRRLRSERLLAGRAARTSHAARPDGGSMIIADRTGHLPGLQDA